MHKYYLSIYFIGHNDYVLEQIREDLTVLEISLLLGHDSTKPDIH
jgi:hypothetical protein